MVREGFLEKVGLELRSEWRGASHGSVQREQHVPGLYGGVNERWARGHGRGGHIIAGAREGWSSGGGVRSVSGGGFPSPSFLV